MSGLVAYGSSDESGSDSESEQASEVVPQVTKNDPILPLKPSKVDEDDEEVSTSEASSDIPLEANDEPLKSKIIDASWELITKKSNNPLKPVKILAPALPKLDDDAKPKVKVKPSTKGCGLFAVLPKPKSTLISPAVVRRPPPKPVLKPQAKKPVAKKARDDEEEDDGSFTGDFFSLTSSVEVPESAFEPVKLNPPETKPPPQPEVEEDEVPVGPQLPPEGMSNRSTQKLSQEALAVLCGRQSTKRSIDDVEIIDVSGQELIGDSQLWLTKDLTEEEVRAVGKGGFTSQQRRKHQITYLAYQAKAQEVSLKNQWAQNRMTRKQTQAKYGF